MPPPEMKSISFPKPSRLEFNSEAIESIEQAMIPNDLANLLKKESDSQTVAVVLLPAFGFLYIAYDAKVVHQYDSNLLETQHRKFQITKTKNDGTVQISQSLQDEDAASAKRLMATGKNILFRFGNHNGESMDQAKQVAE